MALIFIPQLILNLSIINTMQVNVLPCFMVRTGSVLQTQITLNQPSAYQTMLAVFIKYLPLKNHQHLVKWGVTGEPLVI